jgi:hypothetical protein
MIDFFATKLQEDFLNFFINPVFAPRGWPDSSLNLHPVGET